MSSIVATALRFRLLVLAAALGVLTVGVVQLRSAPVDVLPEFTPPYAEVQTEALGLSAEEVEQLITVPLEADLLNGVEGIETIRSESIPGLSSIVMVFTEGTDVYRARQLVEERLTQAHALPNVSKPPTMLQPLSSSSRVLLIGLRSEELTPIEQSVIARWTMKPRLMGVPGVANVAVWGMRDQQLQVQVDPERLQASGVTLAQVISTAGNAQVVSPLTFLEASTPGTGGFIETPQQRLQVRHLLEKIADPEQLGQVPVDGTDGRLRLADVADVVVDHQPLIGDAVVEGEPGLVLVVEKFPGTDARDVTAGVEDALTALAPGLTGMQIETSVFRPSGYIDTAIDNLALVLLIGGMLLLLGLVALRFHWRGVLVAAITVPLSLVTAATALDLLGQGFNALVLAGVAAAAVVMVDEAVVMSDRVVRRLRRRSRVGGDEPVAEIAQLASDDVRTPLVFATAIALLPVLPLAVLGGRPGAFFGSLVLAYSVSVLSALLVAVVVTPALTIALFARWPVAPRSAGRRSGQQVGSRYVSWFGRFAGGRATAPAVTAVLAVLGLAALPFLDVSPVPGFADRNVLVRLDAAPGTSNPSMTEATTDLAGQLGDLAGVAAVGAHVGRAVTGDRVTNVDTADVWVTIGSDADYDGTLAEIERLAAASDEFEAEVVTYTEQKMRDTGALVAGENAAGATGLSLLTGVEEGIGVRVYGQNQEILAQEADKVLAAIASVDGVVDPVVETDPVQQAVEIEVDLDRAQALGVTPGDVRRSEAALLQGIQVGSVFDDQKVFDVIVKGVPSIRESVEDVGNLLIDRPGGGHITLNQVADVRVAESPAAITREAVSRRLDVTAQVSGRSIEDVTADVRAAVAGLSFPMEYHAEVLERSTADEAGATRVVGFGVAALIALLLLLQAAFRSWRLAAVGAVSIAVSMVGGVLVVLVAGRSLSLGAMLGLLALFALATRFTVLFVCRAQVAATQIAPARAHQGLLLSQPVVRAARQRLSPTVATAVGVALLALPAVVLGGRPGTELLGPMAGVVVGGLVTTALVALFVLPALCLPLVAQRPWTDPASDATPPPQRKGADERTIRLPGHSSAHTSVRSAEAGT